MAAWALPWPGRRGRRVATSVFQLAGVLTHTGSRHRGFTGGGDGSPVSEGCLDPSDGLLVSEGCLDPTDGFPVSEGCLDPSDGLPVS